MQSLTRIGSLATGRGILRSSSLLGQISTPLSTAAVDGYVESIKEDTRRWSGIEMPLTTELKVYDHDETPQGTWPVFR